MRVIRTTSIRTKRLKSPVMWSEAPKSIIHDGWDDAQKTECSLPDWVKEQDPSPTMVFDCWLRAVCRRRRQYWSAPVWMGLKYQQWTVLAWIGLDTHAHCSSSRAVNLLVYHEFPSTFLLCGLDGDSGHTMVSYLYVGLVIALYLLQRKRPPKLSEEQKLHQWASSFYTFLHAWPPQMHLPVMEKDLCQNAASNIIQIAVEAFQEFEYSFFFKR